MKLIGVPNLKPHSLLILVASAAVYACQTYVPNLAVDPSFTHQAMTEAAMVIGGVSSDLQNLGVKQSDRYAGKIKMAVEKERPELTVIDAPSLRNNMGSSAYKTMMVEWVDNLGISKKSLGRNKKCDTTRAVCQLCPN